LRKFYPAPLHRFDIKSTFFSSWFLTPISPGI